MSQESEEGYDQRAADAPKIYQPAPSKMVDSLTDASINREVEPKHLFWDTQPVPKAYETLPDEPKGPLDSSKTVADVRQTSYPLPPPFEWVTCDLNNDQELSEIYTLLSQNYVEDDDHMFRFDYSQDFLRWALCPPDYVEDWHVGIRTNKGKLVAFITGIPVVISVHGKPIKMAEINFLCVHMKLRSKRLAPVLIKEITRRVNLRDIWQAIYTAGLLLTKPTAQCSYFHRSLNIKKLVEVQFTSLGKRLTMSMAQKLYRLPETTKITGLRPATENDVSGISSLLTENFRIQSKLYPVFSLSELKHALLPRSGVVDCWVREIDGKLTDFFSFYILSSSVLRCEQHKEVKAAYSFYSVATSVSLSELMHDALIIAKNAGMDVFNCLNLHENKQVIETLRFGKGDGSLKYYLYNYLCPEVQPHQVGLILV